MAYGKSLCTCGGKLIWEKRLVEIAGKNFGHHDVGICEDCNKRFLEDHVMDWIEDCFD